MENSYENTTGDTFGSYLLYELGHGPGHSFRRWGSRDGDSRTDFHPHCCSANGRTCGANSATNNHRSADADHDQGCRRKYTEHATVTRRFRLNLTSDRNAGEQSADEFVDSDGSMSPFGRNVDIRSEWESSQRESEFDESGFGQSRFNQPDQCRFNQCRFNQSRFNQPNRSESSE